MITIFLILSLIALAAVLVGIVLALRMEGKVIQGFQAEHEAWEQTQENIRRGWERKQLKRFTEQEKHLNDTMQAIREEWERLKLQGIENNATLLRRYEDLELRLRLEQEVAVLPHIEDVPLGEDSGVFLARSQWHPAKLRGADLRGRDFSHRFMRSADFEEAQLQNTNLFMADLSEAILRGADLSGADLSGANLSGADMRDAILSGANLQVADLHNTLLAGANLSGARHLTNQQLAAAQVGEMSRVKDDTSLTEPQLPIIRISQPLDHAPQQPEQADYPGENSNGYDPAAQAEAEQFIPETPLPNSTYEPLISDGAEPVAVDHMLDIEIAPSDHQPFVEVDGVDHSIENEVAPPSPSSDDEVDVIDHIPDIEAAPLPPSPEDDVPESIPETPAPVIFDEASDDEPESVGPAGQEVNQAVSPVLEVKEDTAYEDLLPDLESLLASSTGPQFFAPLAPDASLLDLQVTDGLVEQPEQEQSHAPDDKRIARNRKRSRQSRSTKR